jgi:FixJ family two-component response regulator
MLVAKRPWHKSRASAEDIAGGTLAGAEGYLHKGISGEELLDAVECTRAGGRVWLLPAGSEKEAAARLEMTSDEARLTPKDKEGFALVLRRRTNAEIAEVLYISLCAGRKEPRIQHTAQAQPQEPMQDFLSSLSQCSVQR